MRSNRQPYEQERPYRPAERLTKGAHPGCKCLTKPDEVVLEVERFHYHRLASGFLRGWLRVRISGRRLLSIARGMFADAA
jgi:hypothetical protein